MKAENATRQLLMTRAGRRAGALDAVLFDAINDAVCLSDLKGTILECNKVAASLFGKPTTDIIGRPCCQFIHGTLGPIEACPIARVHKTHHRETYVVQMSARWVSIALDPLMDDSGNLIGVAHIISDITDRKAAEERLVQSTEKLKKVLDTTVQAIALTLEMRDPYTAGHQRRTSELAHAIARKLGFSQDDIEGIRVAATLHDIGKICVPAEILSKPGRIDQYEFNIIKRHPEVGHQILSRIEFPWTVGQIVLQHHERMNGSGYPAGLSGQDILAQARIIGVADVVEAMSSHRPYRPALGIDRAILEIRNNRGAVYDRDVVDACVKVLEDDKFEFG
ncbi:MAG: HD domain-containing protein [Bacteroidetes bacterium]|nr:HD domain-containing protein [Bacteroidota bacterium]MCL5026984.1 HD domain-containing protein [Chloroflexota bacterium]